MLCSATDSACGKPPQPGQRGDQAAGRRERTGVQLPRALQVAQRRIPAAEHLLGERRTRQEIGIGRRDLQAGLVRRHRRGPVGHDVEVVVAQRELGFRAVCCQRARAVRRCLAGLSEGGIRGARVVQVGPRPGELGPGLREGGVERHRLLVVADRAAELAGPDGADAARRALAPQVASYAARFAVGFSVSTCFWSAPRATSSAEATFPAISLCTWNTSVTDASNGCCQRVVGGRPATASTSSGLTSTRRVPSAACAQRTRATSR